MPLSEIKCEVCEMVQPPATLCANCGVALRLPPGTLPTADAPIERVPDFEATVGPRVGAVGGERSADIEDTLMPPTQEATREFVPGFEATENLVLDLPGIDEVVPDLEHTTEEFQKTPATPGADNRCQYCGFVQASGRLCDNCGLVRSKVAPLSASARAERDLQRVRCPGCGAVVPLRELCSDCGHPLPLEAR